MISKHFVEAHSLGKSDKGPAKYHCGINQCPDRKCKITRDIWNRRKYFLCNVNTTPVQLFPILLHFLLAKTLRQSRYAVIFIMVFETEKRQVIFCEVFVVSVKMGKLAFFDFVGSIQSKAQATPTTTLQKNAHLC